MVDFDLFKGGYFILVKHEKGWFGNLIKKEQMRFFTEEEAGYTHVMVSMGGEHAVDVKWPRTGVSNIREKFHNRYIKVMKYKEYEETGDRRWKVAALAASKCNLPYDWRGVLAFKIKWLFHHNKRLYFCSELAAWALQFVFIRAFNGYSPERLKPADFQNDSFECVWQGYVT